MLLTFLAARIDLLACCRVKSHRSWQYASNVSWLAVHDAVLEAEAQHATANVPGVAATP